MCAYQKTFTNSLQRILDRQPIILCAHTLLLHTNTSNRFCVDVGRSIQSYIYSRELFYQWMINNTKLSFFLTVSLLSLFLIHVVNLKIQVSCIIVFSVYYNARRKAMCVCVVKYIIGSCICALYPSTTSNILVHWKCCVVVCPRANCSYD